ncbi:undecaprenyl-diphosphate phosphatase [Aureimonas mangrovi]|uniref:undecaprenyl-diphosphate phosphatase n=1 Tax=Aureimonas mangrovi TaxID=2758041 RepID=UPI00163D72CE|nr:undecaprenyl-diphosphate phosphatase [Aureimonas mangrovi]
MPEIFSATLLGVIEGLTEFIPVSSTAHLILVGRAIGFESTGNSFEVLIQLGAVIAVVSVYFAKLWHLFVTLPSSAESRRFVLSILLAFLPAAVIGALAHDFIKSVLFESPAIICIALIVGGFILLAVDRMAIEKRYDDAMTFPPALCLKIGFIQCLAMIPGTSRSGATIAGALLLGAEKRAAAEFSFFLAMPTMAGAFAYDLFRNRDILSANDAVIIAVGFVAALVSGIFVVRYLLDFVSRHGFAPFAYWRIGVGTIGLIAIIAFG